MTTAFVAGSTGYTGRALVQALRRQDITTVAHVRPGSRSLAEVATTFLDAGAEVDTTPWEPEALTETLRRVNPDLVFACLGTTRKRMKAARRAGTEEDYRTVDYGLTAMLVDACLAAGLKPRFVYLSAAGVRDGAQGAYYTARADAEEKVRESGLPYTLARPSFISGDDRAERRPAERIAAKVTDATLGIASAVARRSAIKDKWGSMTGELLARGMVQVALDPAFEDQVAEAAALRAASQSS